MELPVKQRLVGAIVLVAIAVAFVPAILDGPQPESDRRKTALELPVPERSAESNAARRVETVRLEPESAGQRAPKLRPETAARAVAEPPQRPVQAEAATPSQDSSSASPARSEPSPPTAADGPPTVSDAWYVQLGSFGDLANAERLAKEAKSDGFEAQISTIVAQGKTMHRVRVGPVATRDQAEALRQSLAAKGQPGKLATGG